MDYSATFGRHFARLVSLLMHDAGNVVEQKVSLRALVAASKQSDLMLTLNDWEVVVNETTVPGALTGVQDVAAQMAAHSLRQIRFGAGSTPADMLGVARIIASTASPGDGGERATQKLRALGAGTVEFQTMEKPTELVAVGSDEPTLVTAVEGDGSAARAEAQGAAERAAGEAAALLAKLTGADVSKMVPEEALALLDSTVGAEAATKVLDDLVSLAEHSMRVGKPVAVADVFHGVVQREARVPESDGDVKRAYVMAVRRLAKPALLRAVAMLIARRPERKQYCYEILERTGEDGADAVIEQITQAQTTDDRRSLLEVLGELRAAVPALVRMLGDSRWFVVRNAAELLGEIVATDAEEALISLLRHSDDRVRRSATNALLRLGTPNALRGVYDAVNDSSPDVRIQAAAAISTRKDARTSNTLIRAIEDEQDGDVQVAIIAALGKVATAEAVQKLVKMAEPEGRLFKKKTIAFRVAAVQALGDAKTPQAMAALKELLADKEREVRETAQRAIANAAR
jgi:HEAT repeat protein